MNLDDFNYLKTLITKQPYITKFDVLAPHTEITHNLDRFRPLFTSHPGNYVDVYATAFGITDSTVTDKLRNTPWLTVTPITIPGKKFVINRTSRYLPPALSLDWTRWKDEGKESESVFIGLPDEYAAFLAATGWNIDYFKVTSLEEVAGVIAGADWFIGNQSAALSIAIGLGKNYACEFRRDISLAQNECYFLRANGLYF